MLIREKVQNLNNKKVVILLFLGTLILTRIFGEVSITVILSNCIVS
jgi:hypothetical protein